MKVAMLYGKHDIRLSAEAQPENPGLYDVVLKVAFCGVCGSDLHKWTGHMTSDRAGPLKLPKNFGHEYSGTVIEIGKQVTRCKVGDRVSINPYVFCGRCFYCRNGAANFCRERIDYTIGWAEYAQVREEVVYKVPDSVSLEIAALGEPLAACLHAVGLADMRSGATALIVGGGSIGLMTLAAARHSGAAKVILSEPDPLRRTVATQMGADVVLDPREQDLAETVREETDGIGADVAFDCVTTSKTLRQSLDSLRFGGTAIVVGNSDPKDQLPLSPLEIHRRGLVVKGSHSRAYEFDHTVRWMSRLDLAPLITHKMPLESLNSAMETLRDGGSVKILMTP